MLFFHFLRDHATFTFCHPSNAFLPFLHFPESRFQKRAKSIRGVAKNEGARKPALLAAGAKRGRAALIFRRDVWKKS